MEAESNSDSDSSFEYAMTYHLAPIIPILKLKAKIVEPLSIYSYLPICVNVVWIVTDHLRYNAPEYERINISVMVLDSIDELRPFKHIHYSMIESLIKLTTNRKTEKLRKKQGSYFQYIISWFI
jgi:hypothetical protein